MCIKPAFFARFCEALGLPDLPRDARFATFEARLANRDALVALLDPPMRSRTTARVARHPGGKVPIAPVLDLPRALDNPFFRRRGGVVTAPHPARPDLKLVASPIRLDGATLPARAAPGYGADTEAVLAEAGFAAAEIAALRARKVIG